MRKLNPQHLIMCTSWEVVKLATMKMDSEMETKMERFAHRWTLVQGAEWSSQRVMNLKLLAALNSATIL